MRRIRTVLTIASLWGAAVFAGEPKVGHLYLHVRGDIRDVVLADSEGRLDRLNDSVAVAEVPGCSRWAGGIDVDEADTSGVPKAVRKDTVFELSLDHYGRYVVSALAPKRVSIEIEGNYEALDGTETSCTSIVRRDSVGQARRAWAVDVRKGVPRGQCAVRIVRLSKYDLSGGHSKAK